jgi:hypothetical protein
MHRFIAVLLVTAALGTAAAQAAGPSEALSNASRSLSSASGLVVTGSMQTLAASGQVVVGSLEVSGEAVLLVLRGVAGGVEASVKVSAELARALGVGVGTVLTVVAETAGYALSAGGRLIAYLPNEATQALLHQSRVDGM